MIERINNIETVGLYHRAKGSSFGFKKANLIYADNCRGKSTLASIFESCSTGDPSIITSRKTLGSENEQYVDIQFDCGHKVTFDGAQWSEKRQEILVFDADFVERNVYSGGQITPDQRQNLLQFAIGDRAVTTQNEYNLSLENLQNIKINIGSLEDQLNGHHIGLSLREFDEIEFIEEPDKKIEQLRSRLDNAKNIVNLQAKEIPKKLEIPLFDIDSIFFGLNFSLKDVDIEAETKVKDHIKKQRGANLENWLFNGLSHENDEKCPYCGQEITGLDLVKSYRTYFNHEYRLLLKNIEELPQKCEELCSEEVVNNLNNSFSKSRITADNWKEDVDLDELSFESDIALENIRSIYLRLNELISRKQSNPLEKVVQESDKNYIISKWHEVLNCIDNCNTQIDKAIHLIKVFKTNLDSEDIDNLNKQISDIEWSKKRYDPTVVELIEKLSEVKIEKISAETRKITAKSQLDSEMEAILASYKKTINDLLRKFGASFIISEMDHNYLGGAGTLQSDYGLEIRGQNINLNGEKSGFRTSLSESDKRTLAFAFFIAIVKSDTEIAKKIIVIDDPMCSFDLNRKKSTRQELKDIYASCNQLIILAHDVYFLHDLHNELSKKDKQNILTIKIAHMSGDYSDFGAIDLDRECEASYYKHHRILTDFSTGSTTADKNDVAKAIRPMLEGYLHRRFPGLIKKDMLFGKVINQINNADPSSPLRHAKNIVDELNDINSYAGPFHHDTDPAADQVTVSEYELRTFVNRALEVVYKGTV